MFKFKNKSLSSAAAFSLLILLSVFVIHVLKASFLSGLSFPLNIFTSLRREAGAVVFYHRNFRQSEILKQQADFLKNKLNSYNELVQENSRLKQILSFKQKSPFKVTAARVIGQSPDSWSSSIIIDKGRFNGIMRDMTVITYLGLVGRVVEAQEHISKIILVSDPNMAVSALNQRSRQEGLVSGTLGENLIMRYLPLEPDIKENDVIITSGLNAFYPKGLLIGTLISSGREFSGLSSYAVIKPAVNLSDLEEVLVIVK